MLQSLEQSQIDCYSLILDINLSFLHLKKMKAKQSIWLDCDPGLDDAFAIIYAAHNPELNLIAISTSPGNTSLANTTRNALDILYNIGKKDVPVYMGSNKLIKGDMKLAQHMHGSNGLGGVQMPTSPMSAHVQNCLEMIRDRIIKQDDKIIWANTGSLTNLCLLLQQFPEIKDKIQKIVLMGGAIGKGNITPAAQFNIYFDPTAYDLVLKEKGGIPLVMIPLEVTHQNMATQSVFDRFQQDVQIPFSKALLTMLQRFKVMYFNAYKFPFPPIHDPCVIHYILHPEEFETKQALIEVDTYPTSYGRTNCYFSNPHKVDEPLRTIDLVATHLKNEKIQFWDQMFKIFDQIFSEQIQGKIVNSSEP